MKRNARSANSRSSTKDVSVESLLVGSAGVKKFVSMPLMLQLLSNCHDHGNCKYGCTPGPAMALVPVGSPAPNVAERSIFPGIGLICHLIAGTTSVNPELSGARSAAK